MSWKKVLHISSSTIDKRLQKIKKQGIKARNKVGCATNFYSESDVREACADLLEDLPQADKSGFFEKDGVKYGTIKVWVYILEIVYPTIKRYLKKSKVQSIKGKSSVGSIRDFYSEPAVREACADLLEKRKKRKPKCS